MLPRIVLLTATVLAVANTGIAYAMLVNSFPVLAVLGVLATISAGSLYVAYGFITPENPQKDFEDTLVSKPYDSGAENE